MNLGASRNRAKVKKTLTSNTKQYRPHIGGIALRPNGTGLDATDIAPDQRLRLPRWRRPGAQDAPGPSRYQRPATDVVQRRADGHDGFDVDFVREQQGHLHGQVAAGAGADGGDAAEVRGRVPRFSVGERGELVVHPVREGFDVVEEVCAVGFGEEAVVGADDEGVVGEGKFEEPVTSQRGPLYNF